MTGRPDLRLGISDVAPVVSCGGFSARAVVGEHLPITATVFREGHDAVAADVVWTPPGGGDGVVALAEHRGGDRQMFTDHGACREGAAGHDGGDIGDAEAEVSAASHRCNAIEVAPHEHLGCDHVTPVSPVGGSV